MSAAHIRQLPFQCDSVGAGFAGIRSAWQSYRISVCLPATFQHKVHNQVLLIGLLLL